MQNIGCQFCNVRCNREWCPYNDSELPDNENSEPNDDMEQARSEDSDVSEEKM